jgi:hypothetical protein
MKLRERARTSECKNEECTWVSDVNVIFEAAFIPDTRHAPARPSAWSDRSRRHETNELELIHFSMTTLTKPDFEKRTVLKPYLAHKKKELCSSD